jgi:hypothetical protein
MRGRLLLVVRRLHLYLSVFFTPLLLLFIVTGWTQTMNFDHATRLLQNLSQIHTHQSFPAPEKTGGSFGRHGGGGEGGRNHSRAATLPMRWLISLMCVALLISISLGLTLAFTMVRNRVPVWIALILGVATPVAFLVADHFR